jgi:hypothetical protein
MHKNSLIYHAKFIIILFVLIFSNYIPIDSYAKSFYKLDTSKIICEKIDFKDSSYMSSVEKIMSLKITKNWLDSLAENNLALNSVLDQTKFQMKKCYWTIGFYENNDKKLTLWKTFEVEINGFHIYELDAVNPNYKNLIQHKNNEASK